MGYARGDSHRDKVFITFTLRDEATDMRETRNESDVKRREGMEERMGSSNETYNRFHDRSALGTYRPA